LVSQSAITPAICILLFLQRQITGISMNADIR